MSPVVARGGTWGVVAAIVIAACPAVAEGQQAGAAGSAPAPADPARPGPADASAAPGGGLDPASPMATMPDFGVDWPDLATPDAPLAQMPLAPAPPGGPVTLYLPAPDLAAAQDKPGRKDKTDRGDKLGKKDAEAEGERRYAVKIEGLDGVEAGADLVTRFNELSSLHQHEGTAANVAQIDRRAGEDADMLSDLLRAYGYYDAEVDTQVGGVAGPTLLGEERMLVTLVVTPGPLYHFRSVTIPGVASLGGESAGLVRAFGVRSGDPVNADRVTTGVASLRTALGQRGYAFATVGEPDITVDHDTREAVMVVPVDPGRQMRFGAFRITGRKPVFGPRHVALIARIKPDDRYDARKLDDLRRALIQTGIVSIAQITPVRTADPDVFDLDVHLEPSPPRTIAATFGYASGARITTSTLSYLTTTTAGSLGYGTGQGFSAEVDWTHRNLFPPEGALTLRGLLGTQEQLVSAVFRRNNFRARDQVLTGALTVDHLDVPAYRAKSIDLTTGIERQTNIIWQKRWTYAYGLEFFGSDERDSVKATGEARQRTYVVAAIPLGLAYDGTDDLLNPTRGWRLSAHVSPEESLHRATFFYARLQLDGSAYQPIGEHLVLAGRIRLGSIQGGSRDAIAPSRRFYSGGGGSVRGYGYQKIGPRDVDNVPIGGTSLAEFGVEARVRFGNFGVVPFLDGGNLYASSLPSFTGFHYGAGLGGRYYTSFGPIRVDVGTPINPQKGDSRVAVYVSLGQAF